MFAFAGRIGEKIAGFFGEGTIYGKSTCRKKLFENLYDQEAFTQLLSYEAYDEEKGIFLQEGSLGFVVEINPLVGSDQTIERVIQSIFSDLLTEGSSIQILMWADPRVGSLLNRWVEARSKNEMLRALSAKRADFLQSSPKVTARIFRLIISYSMLKTQNEEEDLKIGKEGMDRLIQSLSSISPCYVWKPNDLISHVIAFTHPTLSKEEEEWSWNPLQSLASQMSGGGTLTVQKDHLEIETDTETHFRSFRNIQVPQTFQIGAMGNLIGDVLRDNFRIHHPFYIQYGVYKPKKEVAQGKFWRRAQNIENQGRSSTLVRMIPKLADELSECDYVRRAIDRGESLVYTSLTAGVWAPKGRLAYASQELQSLFKVNQFKLAENRYMHLPTLLWALPMSWSGSTQMMCSFSLMKTTLESECPFFAPLHGEWPGTKSPEMLMLGRRGQLMRWSPFDSAGGNYNCVVVGRSGAGKSVFMQDLLVSGLSTGARVYVLDVGRSFERVCDLLDGQKIEFSRNTTICLNPFSNLSIHSDEDREDAINCLKSVISCMAAPQSGTDDYQTSLIESAIVDVWNRKLNTATVTDVAEWLLKQEDEVARRLGVTLTPYTKNGSYSKYFEGSNNVSFHNPMVLVELEELKEKKDLQTVVL